jgi:hypothetical protein
MPAPLTIPSEQIDEMATSYANGAILKEVAKAFDISPTSVRRLLLQRGVVLRKRGVSRTHEVNERYFDEIGEQQAYWLGFLQGDGSITTEGVTLRLKEADRPHVVAFRDALGSTQSIDENTATMRGKSFVNYSARIYSVRLVRRLGELGLRPRKTFDSEFPDYLTPDLLPHWLRGLFDADGCIHRLANSHSLMWSLCGYEDLMISTRAYIERVIDQGRVKLSNQTSCDSRWASFSYGGITTPRALYRHLYEDATVWLGRKRDIFEQCFRDREVAYGEIFVPAGIRVPIEVLASQMSLGVF